MPYFPEVKVLFIHIPKTGGSSIEIYFKKKSKMTLFSHPMNTNKLIPDAKYRNASLQHQKLHVIKTHSKVLGVPIDDPELIILASVRNPYDRVLSDLFWYKLINTNDNPTKIHTILNRYLSSSKYDNHNIPQHEFLMNENSMLDTDKRLVIMKTESLKTDMIANGFKDFNIFLNRGKYKKGISKYLNKESIELINKYYKKDFELFGYEMRFE